VIKTSERVSKTCVVFGLSWYLISAEAYYAFLQWINSPVSTWIRLSGIFVFFYEHLYTSQKADVFPWFVDFNESINYTSHTVVRLFVSFIGQGGGPLTCFLSVNKKPNYYPPSISNDDTYLLYTGCPRIVCVVYYESRKRELKIRLMNEGRWDERLKTRIEEFTWLTYTGLLDKTK
jgi:hypothetical protein